MSSAGSRLVSLETIDQTETGRRWLIMLLFALTILDNANYTFLLNKRRNMVRLSTALLLLRKSIPVRNQK